MKNIKTYEGWFRKKKTEIQSLKEITHESILKYEDDIKSYINDFEDISFYNEKISDDESIIYSFFIKDFKNKEEEIDIYIEEIESISNSNKILFYYINSYDLNFSVKFKNSNEKITCILLIFAIKSNIEIKKDNYVLNYNSILRYSLNKKCYKLLRNSNSGLEIISFNGSSGNAGIPGHQGII